jgi:hypothetical protein
MTEELTETDLDLMARMHCTIPPKKAGRLELVKFTITDEPDPAAELHYGVRSATPGEYTKLQERVSGKPLEGTLWMSDTPAELKDHLPVARKIADPNCKRVLIMGLGLGCIIKLAASFDHVEDIYVVEQDSRVIKLVGRWFDKEYAGRVHVIEGDAYEQPVGPREHWDVVWHDIWPDMGEDNLAPMHFLHQRYRDHCTWQGLWALEFCMMQQDVTRELVQRVERVDGKKIDVTHTLWKEYNEFLDLEPHYKYFAQQGYVAASRHGHNTVLDELDGKIPKNKTIFGVL